MENKFKMNAFLASSSWGPLEFAKVQVATALQINLSVHYGNEDIFDFLEKQCQLSQNIILLGALTQYSTEANYRFALASLLEGKSIGAVAAVVEEKSNPRVPLIFRAARTLGVDMFLNTKVINDLIIIYFNRGLDIHQLDTWKIDPAPYLNRPNEDQIIGVVVTAIENQTPLSLVRIGHCEVRFIGQDIFYGESDLMKSCQIQWGDTAPTEFLLKVRKDLQNTIKNANVIGFKKRTHLNSRSLNILDNSVLACLSTLNLLKSNHIQSSPNVHFALGESRQFIDAIKKAKKLTIISPRKILLDKFKKICDPTTVLNFHQLPGEARIDGANDIKARISRFIEIENILKAEVTEGEVVLVGAGVAGKIYCEIARSNSGVGIDLGSTLDAWAGIDTRGNGFSQQLKTAINSG